MRLAWARRRGQGLAGQHGAIEFGDALFDNAVDRRRDRPPPAAGGRRLRCRARSTASHAPVGADARGGHRLQRQEIARRRARLLAQPVIEIAPDQQEEEQHGDAVEIGVLAVAAASRRRSCQG